MPMKMTVPKVILFVLVSLLLSQCRLESRDVTKPEQVGMSTGRLQQLDNIVKEAIAAKDFPGAVLLVGRRDRIVFRKAYGESQWVPQRRPMDVKMIFDLSSLTKPIATATSIMILGEQGRISLDEKVKDYIPEFSPHVDEKGKPGEDARIWHLLTHTSGLPSYTDAAEVEKAYGRPCPTDKLVLHIAQLPKTDSPGATFQYSCLGYITLALILEKISGRNIADFSEEYIFKPLEMEHTFFVPALKFRNLFVPTQVIGSEPLSGVVHDPLARLQGGVSGNAGLFSTADDLAVFAQMMLNQGEYRGTRVLSPLSVAAMTSVWPKALSAGRGLGWDLDSAYSSNGGDLFGSRSYGHSGYTGTSIWIDPDTRTYVIFLTNRVHPNDQGAILSLRSRVANVVAASIIDLKESSPAR
jgi:CubicO group peptidase (beta-lactamase class C family)